MKNSKAVAVRPVKPDMLDQDPKYLIGKKFGSIEQRLDQLERQMIDRKLSKKHHRKFVPGTVMTNALRNEINIMLNNAIEYTKVMIFTELKQKGVLVEDLFPDAKRNADGKIAVENPVGGDN